MSTVGHASGCNAEGDWRRADDEEHRICGACHRVVEIRPVASQMPRPSEASPSQDAWDVAVLAWARTQSEVTMLSTMTAFVGANWTAGVPIHFAVSTALARLPRDEFDDMCTAEKRRYVRRRESAQPDACDVCKGSRKVMHEGDRYDCPECMGTGTVDPAWVAQVAARKASAAEDGATVERVQALLDGDTIDDATRAVLCAARAELRATPAPDAVSMAIRLARFEALSEAVESCKRIARAWDQDARMCAIANQCAAVVEELRGAAKPRGPGLSSGAGIAVHPSHLPSRAAPKETP